MLYGVSYYPEHKKRDELEQDLHLIIESGINVVRMGEFAWSRMEAVENEYQFAWLDQVVNKLGEHGIKTIICTPTACPPAWLVEKHPEILYVDNRGIKRPFGGRRHYCYNNEIYRMYSEKIAKELAKHYGNNPYVAGFQIDNEPAQEGSGRCHCKVCQEKFRKYLKDKYQTIEELNRRIGGVFWSQEYNSFDQITIPVNTIEVGAEQTINAFYENPSIRLEFERFASQSQIAYQNIQTAIIKEYTVYPVTTNGTGLATNSIDYYKSTKELDVYAFDYYPGLRNTKVDSFPYGFARGIKSGKPFWVMEFMSGGGHRFSGSGRQQPNPGALKQAVIQAYAHGAKALLHFQFRTFPFGAEQLNYAIVDMDGIPRRRYYEMKDTAALLNSLEVYEDAKFQNEAAICISYDTHWALRIKPVNDPEYNYLEYCGKLYQQMMELGINTDIISMEEDFNKYKVILLPSPFILEEKDRNKLKSFAKSGGSLVTTFLCSVKNEDNVGYTDSLPAGLTDLFQVTVEEVEPVFSDNKARIKLITDSKELIGEDNCWSDLLSGKAKMIGTYMDSYKEGKGIVSENSYGKGDAYYIGTVLSENVMKGFLKDICNKAGLVSHPFAKVSGIEVVKRIWRERPLYILINQSGSPIEIPLHRSYLDCISNCIIDGRLSMDTYGYAILCENS